MSHSRQQFAFTWRKGILAVVVLTAAVVTWIWQLASGPSLGVDRTFAGLFSTTPVKPALLRPNVPVGDATVLHADAQGKVQLQELVEVSRQLNAPDSTIEHDFEVLHLLLDAFRQSNGGAPPISGENVEVVEQLRGQNAAKVTYIAADHSAIDDGGRLLDRWGTPFFFHPLSRDNWQIRSAGKDRQFFTSDDAIQ
ncbi:hypothetical protein [Brevifollis gellanilyticus]|uniref:Uncharacterized protein n=1 Tax=Brevifollis gellanilyticus TaxID=748831 RepID=A0A512M2Q7_9BACT|nr:hypothetical protein [Brevifollis gellanilyticus]GEP40988.1 hypothetical protein BGE01nite_02790 [Brevifollis gellanilyticus]